MATIMRHAGLLVVRRTLFVFSLIAALAVIGALIPPKLVTPPAIAPEQTRAELLIERHDCWTGKAPADVDMPGHVIWQHPDGRTVYSARLVGPALDTIFADGNLPGRAVAFCR